MRLCRSALRRRISLFRAFQIVVHPFAIGVHPLALHIHPLRTTYTPAGKQDPPVRGAGYEPVPSRRSI